MIYNDIHRIRSITEAACDIDAILLDSTLYVYIFIRPNPMLCPARLLRLAMSCWICVAGV